MVSVAFRLHCCERARMRYLATTDEITVEMVQDLLLESVKYSSAIQNGYLIRWKS